MSNIKSKLLRKYLGDTPVDRNNKKQLSCNKITVKDNEDLGLELSSDSSVADEQVPRDRIESSDEDKQS